jgi:hypothetical protein
MRQFFILLLLCCSIIACKSTKTTKDNPANANKIIPKQAKVKATVVNMTGLDGCGYLLELENGEKLIPLNLEEKYFSDKMKVWIAYSITNSPTICMVGKAINIQSIEERKE